MKETGQNFQLLKRYIQKGNKIEQEEEVVVPAKHGKYVSWRWLSGW